MVGTDIPASVGVAWRLMACRSCARLHSLAPDVAASSARLTIGSALVWIIFAPCRAAVMQAGGTAHDEASARQKQCKVCLPPFQSQRQGRENKTDKHGKAQM